MNGSEHQSFKTRQTDGVLWVTIDHPPSNLVDGTFIVDLIGMLGQLDGAVRVVVFDSADPDFFLMHGDVTTIKDLRGPYVPATEPNMAASTFDRLRSAPFATIGLVEGQARGGGAEFLASLDMRFAGPGAVLGQPEVAMGILPGASGTQRLPRMVGRARALEIILGCGDVTADEAAAMGYVNRVLPTAELRPFVEALAQRIARFPAEAIAGAKRAVDAALPEVEPGLTVESDVLAQLTAGGHHGPLMERFLELGGQTRAGELERMADIIDAMG